MSELFPYPEFRSGQYKIYSKVKNFLDSSSGALFIEAPTGIGKTSAILAPILETNRRVLFFVRTHNEQDIIQREVNRINEKFNRVFKYTAVKGISSHCKIREVRFSALPHQRCKWNRKIHRAECMDCEYREQWERAKLSEVASAPYSYLSKQFRSLIKPLISENVVVFDEAHSLLLPPEIIIPEYYIRKAEEELLSKIDRKNIIQPTEEFINSLHNAGLKYWDKHGESYTLELSDLLKNAEKLYKTESGFGYADFSVSETVQGFQQKKIFTSATIPKCLPEVLGMKPTEYDILRVSVPLKARYVIYTDILVPLPQRRSEAFKIARLLHILAMYRSLAVFPSTEYANYLMKWHISGATRDVERFTSGTSPLLIVAGDVHAEGVDLDVAEIGAVVGVPFAKPTPYLFQVYAYYRKRFPKKLKQYFYLVPAIIRGVQGVGRAVRSPDQRKLIIFADWRWTKYYEFLPKWLQDQRFERIDELEILKEYIVRFNLNLRVNQWLREKQRTELSRKVEIKLLRKPISPEEMEQLRRIRAEEARERRWRKYRRGGERALRLPQN